MQRQNRPTPNRKIALDPISAFPFARFAYNAVMHAEVGTRANGENLAARTRTRGLRWVVMFLPLVVVASLNVRSLFLQDAITCNRSNGEFGHCVRTTAALRFSRRGDSADRRR